MTIIFNKRIGWTWLQYYTHKKKLSKIYKETHKEQQICILWAPICEIDDFLPILIKIKRNYFLCYNTHNERTGLSLAQFYYNI